MQACTQQSPLLHDSGQWCTLTSSTAELMLKYGLLLHVHRQSGKKPQACLMSNEGLAVLGLWCCCNLAAICELALLGCWSLLLQSMMLVEPSFSTICVVRLVP